MYLWIVISIICYGCWYFYNKESEKLFKNNPSIKSSPTMGLDSYDLKRIQVDKSNKKLFGGIALAAILFGGYQSFIVPANNVKNVETQRSAFLDGYVEGWYFECDTIFNNSVGPGGILYAGSNQYSESWCQNLLNSSVAQSAYVKAGSGMMAQFSSVENEKRKGTGAGAIDAINTVFSYTPYLCYGTECTSKSEELDSFISLGEP